MISRERYSLPRDRSVLQKSRRKQNCNLKAITIYILMNRITTTNYRPTIGREDTIIKPKRPLSAYNLFYRYKRLKVVEALASSNSSAVDKEVMIHHLVTAAPGLEMHRNPDLFNTSHDELGALRRRNICKYLKHNTEARDTETRLHRKNKGSMNGAMSLVELGKLMNTSWRDCDEFAKSVFQELADEGRKKYRQRIKQYTKDKKSLEKKACLAAKKDEAALIKPNMSQLQCTNKTAKKDDAATVTPRRRLQHMDETTNMPRRLSLQRRIETAETLIQLSKVPFPNLATSVEDSQTSSCSESTRPSIQETRPVDLVTKPRSKLGMMACIPCLSAASQSWPQTFAEIERSEKIADNASPLSTSSTTKQDLGKLNPGLHRQPPQRQDITTRYPSSWVPFLFY